MKQERAIIRNNVIYIQELQGDAWVTKQKIETRYPKIWLRNYKNAHKKLEKI